MSRDVCQEVVDVLTNYGIVASKDFIQVLLDDSPMLYGEVVECGANDTECSSKLANAISRKLIGKSWPMYGNTQEYKDEFYKAFAIAAKEHGLGWEE